MKISTTTKLTFILAILHIIIGMILNINTAIIIGIISCVILSAQVEILEAIHKLKEDK